MIKKFIRFSYTIRYLKPIQIYYRLYFTLLKVPVIHWYRSHWKNCQRRGQSLMFSDFIAAEESTDGKTFSFLNLKHTFDDKLDWNYCDYGKLWTYKLNYFNFINCRAVSPDLATRLINSYCDGFHHITTGLEPYPVSLRSINWIKFFSQNRPSEKWDKVLYTQLRALYWLTEYHLLGNHLLENGFALLFGAYYYQDETFYNKAENILKKELAEQILEDGGHFERSPMYHTIILERVLDSYNLIKNNRWKKSDLESLLSDKAAAMLGWLQQVTFENGELPQVNDTVFAESPGTNVLVAYAQRLEINPNVTPLKASGYRVIKTYRYELLIDVGNIGPDYIPGHAHSDTFNFILYKGSQPLIVETGTSTYQAGERRILERSTGSHNTVVVNQEEQTQVWGSFRVGRRAKIIHLDERDKKITALHDGYEFMGLHHQRSWEWDDQKIMILDKLIGKTSGKCAHAFIHFFPGLDITFEQALIRIGTSYIQLEGHTSMEFEDYDFATGFNKSVTGQRLKISFTDQLKIIINLES